MNVACSATTTRGQIEFLDDDELVTRREYASTHEREKPSAMDGESPPAPSEPSGGSSTPMSQDGGGEAALAEAMALLESGALDREDGPMEWRAVQVLPEVTRAQATKRRPSRKTLKLLRWITKLWTEWVRVKAIVIAGMAGPSWQQVGRSLS